LKIISPNGVELADETPSKMTAENYADHPLVILNQDGKKEIALSASIWILLTRIIGELGQRNRFNLIDKSGRLRLNLLQLVWFLASDSLARRAVPSLELIVRQNL
jgi:hypothetical protein